MTQKEALATHTSLLGKVCVVVGGTGLVGKDISRKCGEQGAQVVIVGRDEEKGKSLVSELEQTGSTARFISCDVTNESEVISMVERVQKQYGRIDGLVVATHLTNSKQGKSLFDTEYADFISYMDMHLGSAFLLVREVGQKMTDQQSGSIVLLGSIYGTTAPRFEIFEGTTQTVRPEYAMAKGALTSFMTYCAKYLGTHGIRVNTVSPGAVKRESGESVVPGYLKHVLVEKRLAEPEDISPLVSLLLSDTSSYITGQNIMVDGGWSL